MSKQQTSASAASFAKAMDAEKATADKGKKNLQVVDSRLQKGTLFAEFVGVTSKNGLTTLDFLYKHPRNVQGELVSRVTLPDNVALKLAEIINKECKVEEIKL